MRTNEEKRLANLRSTVTITVIVHYTIISRLHNKSSCLVSEHDHILKPLSESIPNNNLGKR